MAYIVFSVLQNVFNPWVVQGFKSSYSFMRVNDQHSLNKVNGIIWYLVPVTRDHVVTSSNNHGHKFFIIVLPERWVSDKQQEQNNSACPDVNGCSNGIG